MTLGAVEELRSDDSDSLFDAIVSLRDVSEAERFFRDLCTRRELEDMIHRWAVARLLDQGHTYRDISAETGVSTATVTRISQWLNHGTGGYRLALDRAKGRRR